MMTDIEAVRLKAADRSALTREEGVGDGEAYAFKLGHNSVLASPAPEVRIENILQVANYTVDYNNGVISFVVPPVMNSSIEFTYYWSIFTDEQIQYFLDDSGGNVTVAAAKVLLAIAADAAKIAQRQSLAGGGGLGAVTIDTSVASRELRAAAKALLEMEAEISGNIPAEGLTEIYWTEMSYKMGVEQSVVRDS
jgi:hypothetical protein